MGFMVEAIERAAQAEEMRRRFGEEAAAGGAGVVRGDGGRGLLHAGQEAESSAGSTDVRTPDKATRQSN